MGHHYVPQAHLKCFSIPDRYGFVYLYDKKTGRFSDASVKKIAQQREYYSAEVEAQLNALVEGPANKIFTKLRAGKLICESDKVCIAIYVGTMLKRVPRRREKALAGLPELIDETMARIRKEVEEIGRTKDVDQDLLERGHRELDEAQQHFHEETPPQVLEEIRTPWPSRDIVAAIFGMTWRFVSTTGPSYFLTSDCPACFFERCGLANPESELTFPVSSELALLGSWQPGPDMELTIATQQLVKEVNRRTASMATRFLFYRERASWIPKIATKKHRLNRILWNS